ncbi:T9SS type A sorting domain-containing protein [Flavobacteriaceae bacterium Ap0902]|nr:T9SS type A sorting domain-containing protein [Flavobacteriaceae bacterium Ap0902]
MKNLIVILLLLLGLSPKAQQTELIENTWYLNELIVDGESCYPPSNEEIDSVTMKIYMEDNQYFFYSEVCSTLGGLLNWVTDSQFSFFDFAGGFDCQNPENQNFELLYAQFYGEGGSEGVPFDYVIDKSLENSLFLTVKNQYGDSAIYNNRNLSVQEIQNNKITIYPNPVVDKIVLSNFDSFENLKIEIFDLQGKLILKREENSGKREFDLSGLKSGVYIITVLNTANEKLISKKLIKK